MAKLMQPGPPRPMTETRKAIRTPRAAALAGIIFALLFTTSIVLIRLAIPDSLAGPGSTAWLQGRSGSVTLALTLIPFAGIAFLWFMGVVRDRLGSLEDQFFSTVFFGSGMLFLALVFIAGAIAGAILTSYERVSDAIITGGVLAFAREAMYIIINVYAIRMAGVFMISLGTLWLRTGVMPRIFTFVTYALALLMLLTINFSVWLILVFPSWVFVISVYILYITMRGEKLEAEELLGAPDPNAPS